MTSKWWRDLIVSLLLPRKIPELLCNHPMAAKIAATHAEGKNPDR
jgi:hypothetical protein